MEITIGKILGLLIALGYAVGMIVEEGGITWQVFEGSVWYCYCHWHSFGFPMSWVV